MSWYAWIAAVQEIARSRNLILTTTYVGSSWVTFNWRAANGTRYGSGGAGAEFIYLTTPEQYTWDWYGLATPVAPGIPPPPPPPYIPPPHEPPVPANPWERRGRFVPRVPAMAVSDALQALFRIGT